MKNKIIPDNASTPRYIVADQTGIPYINLNSLEEAKGFSDGVVIFEGDFGGVIYLVCIASLVKCSLLVLNQLLQDLDSLTWGKQNKGSAIFYERHQIGDLIAGGSGGGKVTNGIWLNPRFFGLNFQPKVEEIINGQSDKL